MNNNVFIVVLFTFLYLKILKFSNIKINKKSYTIFSKELCKLIFRNFLPIIWYLANHSINICLTKPDIILFVHNSKLFFTYISGFVFINKIKNSRKMLFLLFIIKKYVIRCRKVSHELILIHHLFIKLFCLL